MSKNASSPSLIQLIEYTDSNPEKFSHIDTSVLKEYMENSTKKYYDGKYFLGGQLQLLPSDPITMDRINEVNQINLEKEKTYGGPCNMWEYASIIHHNQLFECIQKIIALY